MMRRLHHEDLHLAYRVAGAGETVLLLHGSAGSHLLWRRLSRALESRYRVVAPDLLGYGRSSGWRGASPFNLDDEIAPLRRLLPESDGLHIVGYSYGAVVALGLALAGRRALSSLAIIEPVAFRILRDIGQPDMFEEVRCWRRRFETQIRDGNVVQAMRGFVEYWSGAGAWDALDEEAHRRLLAAVPKILLDLRVAFETRFDIDALAELAPPTLLLCGGRSPRPTRRLTSALAKLVGQGELAIIDTAGHDLPVTHAEELNGRILAHLAARSAQDARAVPPR